MSAVLRLGRAASFEARQQRFGLLLTLPALGAFLALILGPFVNSLWLSVHEYKLESEFPKFVGFANFQHLAADSAFWESWRTTIVYVVITTLLTTLAGSAYALLLNEPMRGRAGLRAASLFPWVLPSTVTAFLWAWMFNGQYGIINAALLMVGVIDKPIFWLSNGAGALLAVIAAKAWLSTPVVMLFVMAALQSLSQDQIEAARIDGASDLAVIRHIVIPHIKRTLGIVVVLQAMGNLQLFDVIYAMTSGGPVHATTVLSIEVYRRAFENWDLGMASAVGVIWFLTIAFFAIYYLRTLLKDA